MDGSVVFSSFHASKGSERKYVYVLGFEANYFRYFARDSKPHICPNTLYVAATRAKECICIAGHKAQKHRLQFLAPERESVWNDYVLRNRRRRRRRHRVQPSRPSTHMRFRQARQRCCRHPSPSSCDTLCAPRQVRSSFTSSRRWASIQTPAMRRLLRTTTSLRFSRGCPLAYQRASGGASERTAICACARRTASAS